MSYLLAPLKEVTPDRHKKAIRALRDGSLTVTLTFKTEAEIRALVKNGDGNTYGVTLTEHSAFCSCPDAMHRGVVCKHAVALCVTCLQKNEPAEDRVHLWWPDGTAALCGETHPKRFWIRWTYNALNWSDIVCQACVHVWLNPVQGKAVSL